MYGAKTALIVKNSPTLWFLWIGPFACIAATIGLYINGAGGAIIAGIAFGILGLMIGRGYIINRASTWNELIDIKKNEKKRILDNESGETRNKSLERLAEKRICRVEGSIHSKSFSETWNLVVKDGDKGVLCQFADNKDSKTIEKFKQKTDGHQPDYVKLMGYLVAPGEKYEGIENDTANYVLVGCQIV